MVDARQALLESWLKQYFNACTFTLTPLPIDASFRRYFRVSANHQPFIAMDAPPDKENIHPFIAIAKIFKDKKLCVPEIFAENKAEGFLLLTDFGDDLYSRILTPLNANQLYSNAIRDLLVIQTCEKNSSWNFPLFDEMMIEELQRFRKWYLLTHLNLNLSVHEENLLTHTFEMLVDSAKAQPQVCVHRDYHSRNLLALPDNQTGILDFQDAVFGPVTYDLVSLIRDCYIAWPKENVQQWALHYCEQAMQQNILQKNHKEEFIRWFDWMGMQRHLKAIYIFARKFRRDQNSGYLGDIPRTLNYLLEISNHYPEFKIFNQFLSERVLPYESHDIISRPRTTHETANRHNA